MENELKRIEEKFHELLRTGLDDEVYDIDGVEVTESLFSKSDGFIIPFGFMHYFLAIEGDKPLLFLNVATRMDTDSICIIDGDSYDCYDVFLGEHKDIIERFHDHLRKLDKSSRDLRDIRKTRKEKEEK